MCCYQMATTGVAKSAVQLFNTATVLRHRRLLCHHSRIVCLRNPVFFLLKQQNQHFPRDGSSVWVTAADRYTNITSYESFGNVSLSFWHISLGLFNRSIPILHSLLMTLLYSASPLAPVVAVRASDIQAWSALAAHPNWMGAVMFYSELRVRRSWSDFIAVLKSFLSLFIWFGAFSLSIKIRNN